MATSIRLPDDLDARLEKLSSKTGRTKSFYIREAIEEHIGDLEDFYLAERRMRAYDSTENATLDEMMTRHGVAR
jgi:RHH-type transcriptional regulator, rel operon repressor / antitoxin RelB